MNQSRAKVTMTDIAQQSDVSPATVSLVLRDKPGVSDETRQRVLDVAHELGYQLKVSTPAPPAHNLSRIGLLLRAREGDLPQTNHFYSSVLAGIEAACRQAHINLLYATMLVDEHNNPLNQPRLLVDETLDGLLLVGAFLNDRLHTYLEQYPAPMVLVDAYATDESYDAVVSDNLMGGFEATEYLIAQGHRQIAIVGSRPMGYPSIQARRRGYAQAMSKHGLPPIFMDCLLTPEAAGQATAALLAAHPTTTAVFACNDEVAIAVVKAAKEHGRVVPTDLSVIGFDNIDLAQYVTPALTTMCVDKLGMGRLGVQLLLNRVQFPTAGTVQAVIRPQLIERQSVMPHQH